MGQMYSGITGIKLAQTVGCLEKSVFQRINGMGRNEFGGTTTLYFTTQPSTVKNTRKLFNNTTYHFINPGFYQLKIILPATFQQLQENLWQKETLRYWIGQHILPTVILSRIVAHHIYRNCYHYQNLTDLKSAIQSPQLILVEFYNYIVFQKSHKYSSKFDSILPKMTNRSCISKSWEHFKFLICIINICFSCLY